LVVFDVLDGLATIPTSPPSAPGDLSVLHDCMTRFISDMNDIAELAKPREVV
jgi:hypothetical protein